jgi:hypothetical protein
MIYFHYQKTKQHKRGFMDTTKQYRKEKDRRFNAVDKRKEVKAIWAFMATVAFVMTVHALPEFLSQFH